MEAIKRRRRLGTQGWRDLLAQFVVSRLTVSAFCERERVSAASFYRWRSLVGVGSEEARSDSAAPAAPAVVRDKREFVDLGALSAADVLPSGFELRLDMGGGLLLQLRRG